MTEPDLKYKVLTETQLAELSVQARALPRWRINYNFHELADQVQRMLNAIEPDSYVRPHRHLNPPKCEFFLVLRGSLAVLIFNDDGTLQKIIKLTAAGPQRGIDIRVGCWHSLVSLEPGTVIFETKDGPYVAATDKDFASWAPAEEERAEAQEYLKKLKEAIA